MNHQESAPEQKRHTSIVPFSLDVDQRGNVIQDFRELRAELHENPYITPAESVTELKGIQLRPRSGKDTPSYMQLKTITPEDKPATTHLAISGSRARRIEQRMYIHRPSLDIWEEWRPGLPEATKILDNSSLITTLEPFMPSETFQSVFDAVPSGTEVVELLSGFLRKKARTHIKRTHFKAHGLEVGSVDYTRDSDFVVETTNNRVRHNLFVAASYMLDDFGPMRKTYAFEEVDSKGIFKSINSHVEVSGQHTIPKSRLESFAQRDLLRNDPALSIKVGLDDIRDAYTAPKKVA